MKIKMDKTNATKSEHCAFAKAQNVSVSAKQSIEISNHLRYKKTSFAKKFLEDVVAKRKAVPFRRFNKDTGHKAGIGPGRFPQKTAAEFLRLIKSVEGNAQNKGLNTADLKIVKILANRASVPFSGGRNRTGTKRSHLEIVVEEKSKGRKVEKNKPEVKAEEKPVVKENKTKETLVEEKLMVKEKSESVKRPVAAVPVEDITAEDKFVEPAAESVVELVTKTIRRSTSEPVKELSPADLLAKAQQQGKQKVKRGEDESTREASRLFEELKKKGTLRGKNND